MSIGGEGVPRSPSSLLISRNTRNPSHKQHRASTPRSLNFTIGCVIGSVPERPEPLDIPNWLPGVSVIVIVVMTFQKGAVVQDRYTYLNDQSEVRQ